MYYVSVNIPPRVREFLGSKTSHVTRSLKVRVKDNGAVPLGLAQKCKDEADLIRAEFVKAKKAASGDAIKFQAEQWKKRIAAKEFDGAKFVAEVRRVQESKGDAAAAELSARSFNLFTDLDFMEDQWLKNFDAKYVSRCKYSLKLLREHLTKLELEQCIEDVSAKVALSFARHLNETGVHTRTGKSYLSALRSRWAYWIDQQVIEEAVNPWAGVTMDKNARRTPLEKKPRPPTDDELTAMFLADMPQPLFDLAALLVTTGLRRGETFFTKTKHVTPGWILAHGSKSESAYRRVPISKFMQPLLARMLKGREPDDYLFKEEGTSTKQKPGYNIGQEWLRWTRAKGLYNPASSTPHKLRHWYITKSRSLGNDKQTIKSVVGHSTGERDVTDIYTEIDDFGKVQVAESVINGATINVMAGDKVKKVFRPGLPVEVRKIIAARFGRD